MLLRTLTTRCALLLSLAGIACAGTLSGCTAPFMSAHASAPAQLTLHLPRSSYPRNALVDAMVSVRNVSGDLIWLDMFHRCASTNPNVIDLDDAGHAYPAIPFTPYDIPAGCPITALTPTTSGIVRARERLSAHVYVVLHAPQLQVNAYLSIFHHCVPWKSHRCRAIHSTVTGHSQVRLTAATAAPRIVLHRDAAPWLQVQSTKAGSGPIFYSGSYACWDKSSGSTGGFGWDNDHATDDLHWGKTSGTRIDLPFGKCRHLVLHVAAGQIGRSIGTLNYTGPNQ